MAAPFHADHVVGTSIADLSTSGTGVDTMLHVSAQCLIVVMHKAPFETERE
jgi:hypothetical protein